MGEGSDGSEKVVCFQVQGIGRRKKIWFDADILGWGSNLSALEISVFLIEMNFGGVGGVGHFGDELGSKSGPRDEVSLSDGLDKAGF